MLQSALLLASSAVILCAIATRIALSVFGLSAVQTLLYLGLAEVPPPPAGRRRVSRT